MATSPETSQKKITSSTSPTLKPKSNTDHRKKPRNRTTQSCLNCHNSKRMCDRKRPACSRCTQLGLTGLCIYEVDDPKQRTIANEDESARLLKRVAELEGVVRELKNKPHPRWAQSPRAQEDGGDMDSSDMPAPSLGGDYLPGSPSRAGPHNVKPSPLLKPIKTGFLAIPSPSRSHSGSTTPSSALLTPSDEFSNPFSSAAVSGRSPLAPECDFSVPLGVIESTFGSSEFFGPDKHAFQGRGSHCGCLHDPTSYRTMLELSIGLRRAATVLRQSPSHQSGGFCALHQSVLQLDAFTVDTLSSPLSSHRPTPSPAYAISASNTRPWDLFTMNSGSPTSFDDSDSFMSWEPSRP